MADVDGLCCMFVCKVWLDHHAFAGTWFCLKSLMAQMAGRRHNYKNLSLEIV